MRGLNSSFASGSEELLDSTMPEALDHAYSVARRYSLVKHADLRLEPLPHLHINRSASTSTTRLRRGTPSLSACASIARSAALSALREAALRIR